MEYAVPVVTVVLAWWASTIVVMYRAGLPERSYLKTLAGATFALAAGFLALLASVYTGGVAGAYLGFFAGLLIWVWHEVTYLFGFVTGPRPEPCPPEVRGWQRFVRGVKTCIYHELAIIATAAVLAIVTWHADNKVALWTFCVLWFMRWSVKLNIFLGVRNLHFEYLPAHLGYLDARVRLGLPAPGRRCRRGAGGVRGRGWRNPACDAARPRHHRARVARREFRRQFSLAARVTLAPESQGDSRLTMFPFSAIVGQDDMKQALMIAAVDRSIGGVLLFGDRGTGKSTAIRALASLLPKMRAVVGCPYSCDPDRYHCDTSQCGVTKRKSKLFPVPVVDLPLGVTEDRVVGALDIEKALVQGQKSFDPGLLARANRGFEDHIVDLLLDVAASGENLVEREGLSVRHPARFVLVGSGNPEEGELRPQLLDRFGLAVEVSTSTDVKGRVEVIKRRDAYERDPEAFRKKWSRADGKLRRRIVNARERIDAVEVSDDMLAKAAQVCMALETDGSRGELTLIRAARAHAALVAPMALSHRLRRNPLDESSASARVERVLEAEL